MWPVLARRVRPGPPRRPADHGREPGAVTAGAGAALVVGDLDFQPVPCVEGASTLRDVARVLHATGTGAVLCETSPAAIVRESDVVAAIAAGEDVAAPVGDVA